MRKITDSEVVEARIEELEKTVQALEEREAALTEEIDNLRKIKKYYDALMQNTEDYILICDREGIPQAFNESYRKRTEKVLGFEMKPGIQPHKIAGTAESIRYWESLQEKALKGERFVAEFFNKKNGTYFETKFYPVKDGRDVTGFTEITRDITERKKTEKALKESNSFVTSLLEYSPIAIYVIDPDTAIKYVNPVFEKLSGYTSEEIIGIKHPYPWMVDDAKYGDIQKRQKEGVRNSERQFRKKNGEISWVDLDVTPIYHNNELSYSVGTWIDISERKKSEIEKKRYEERLKRSEKMESLGLLASGVAHDLNNVLAGIVSYPDLLLLDLPPDSGFRKPLKTIRASGNRAAAIVQDLLTIARGVATEKKSFNLNRLIIEYLESPEAKELLQNHSSITIETDLDDALLNVKGSYIHLRKAVMNLVLNSLEAIEKSGNITISTRNRFLETPLKAYDNVKAGEYAVTSITDSGTGISSADLERIFEPFYTKKIMGRSGTGLGLAVVWNVMREHDGYINVKSGNRGTTFDLFLPITREESSIDGPGLPIDALKGNGETVLVVDDIESQRDICVRIVEKLGYTAHAVASGEEAVEYLKRNRADLVLLDMIMDPGINGRETFERILEIHPRQKVILVSGLVETDEVKKAQKLGAGQLVKKPFTLKNIGAAIKEEINKRLAT